MSMPIIKPSCVTRCEAITDIIESVALEQTALSHILNAEGEKLQKIISMQKIEPCELLQINKSVQKTINAVTNLEIILQAKLELFSCNICDECKTCEYISLKN